MGAASFTRSGEAGSASQNRNPSVSAAAVGIHPDTEFRAEATAARALGAGPASVTTVGASGRSGSLAPGPLSETAAAYIGTASADTGTEASARDVTRGGAASSGSSSA